MSWVFDGVEVRFRLAWSKRLAAWGRACPTARVVDRPDHRPATMQIDSDIPLPSRHEHCLQ